MKRVLIVLIIIIVLLLLPMAILALVGWVNRASANRGSTVVFEDYKIRICPVCETKSFDDQVDSCMLIINDIRQPSVLDTLVYYPHEGSSLNILMSDNHKWEIANRHKDNHCSSHFLDISYNTDKRIDLNQDIKAVLTLEQPSGQYGFYLWGSRVEGCPPYYSKLLYPRHRSIQRSFHQKAASATVGSRTIEWKYSRYYNYALIKNERGICTDTLRWPLTPFPYNSWEFIMVGDTIIVSDNLSVRPSCQSPLIVKRAIDVMQNYPHGYKANMTSESWNSGVAVTLIRFTDKQSWFSRETIEVSVGYLEQSPIEGRIVNDSFFKEHLFIRKE